MEKETRQGFCRFCNAGILVEVNENATQREADLMATEACDCIGAEDERKRKAQKEGCLANIEEILGGKHPEIAELFGRAIDAIQESKIQKITASTYENQTARICKTKDGIKVELEKKQKEESLA